VNCVRPIDAGLGGVPDAPTAGSPQRRAARARSRPQLSRSGTDVAPSDSATLSMYALIILIAAAVPQARPSLADDEQVDHSGQRQHGSGGTTARRGRQTRSSAAPGANGVVRFSSSDGQLRRTRPVEIGATIRNGRHTDEGVANPQ
jgi:hypothetical protein